MSRYHDEEVYNGPRHHAPIHLGEDAGSCTDSAFAKGREMFKQGFTQQDLAAILRSKRQSVRYELRRGYAWQKARSAKA